MKCTRMGNSCRKGYGCPYYHNEKDRRRSPSVYIYSSASCPFVKLNSEWLSPSLCENGDKCVFCHTRTEQQFHPEIYKSNKCHDMIQTNYCPRGYFCAFAHVIPNPKLLNSIGRRRTTHFHSNTSVNFELDSRLSNLVTPQDDPSFIAEAYSCLNNLNIHENEAAGNSSNSTSKFDSSNVWSNDNNNNSTSVTARIHSGPAAVSTSHTKSTSSEIRRGYSLREGNDLENMRNAKNDVTSCNHSAYNSAKCSTSSNTNYTIHENKESNISDLCHNEIDDGKPKSFFEAHKSKILKNLSAAKNKRILQKQKSLTYISTLKPCVENFGLDLYAGKDEAVVTKTDHQRLSNYLEDLNKSRHHSGTASNNSNNFPSNRLDKNVRDSSKNNSNISISTKSVQINESNTVYNSSHHHLHTPATEIWNSNNNHKNHQNQNTSHFHHSDSDLESANEGHNNLREGRLENRPHELRSDRSKNNTIFRSCSSNPPPGILKKSLSRTSSICGSQNLHYSKSMNFESMDKGHYLRFLGGYEFVSIFHHTPKYV